MEGMLQLVKNFTIPISNFVYSDLNVPPKVFFLNSYYYSVFIESFLDDIFGLNCLTLSLKIVEFWSNTKNS